MPLDQTLMETAARAQARLDPRHAAGVALVIVAKQMQQPVKGQHAKLGAT
jgi:hypothetical protein